ncbi:hypothetical protein KIN20_034878 [Parelaphostrongylus tenuis]|uniref:Uncharacterized protein n=1 Tax=Parelaphostrongylus tenuis TaxID=148309 RepID=A0AAD5RB00_PARTN|nr:hypothetical protein KIN20_034878 [Parelaphostrongylus tenuis]
MGEERLPIYVDQENVEVKYESDQLQYEMADYKEHKKRPVIQFLIKKSLLWNIWPRKHCNVMVLRNTLMMKTDVRSSSLSEIAQIL